MTHLSRPDNFNLLLYSSEPPPPRVDPDLGTSTTLTEKKAHTSDIQPTNASNQVPTVASNILKYKFICKICKKSFLNLLDIKKHFLQNHCCTGDKFKCKESDFIHSFTKNLNSYNENICFTCCISFKTRKLLLDHMLSHPDTNLDGDQLLYTMPHPSKSISVKSPQESKMSPKLNTLIPVHQLRQESVTGKYFCQYCFKMFNYSYEFAVHQRIHDGKKPFLCFYCPKSYIKEKNILCHLKYKHDCDHFKALSCVFCSAEFHSEDDLQNHRVIVHPYFRSKIEMFDMTPAKRELLPKPIVIIPANCPQQKQKRKRRQKQKQKQKQKLIPKLILPKPINGQQQEMSPNLSFPIPVTSQQQEISPKNYPIPMENQQQQIIPISPSLTPINSQQIKSLPTLSSPLFPMESKEPVEPNYLVELSPNMNSSIPINSQQQEHLNSNLSSTSIPENSRKRKPSPMTSPIPVKNQKQDALPNLTPATPVKDQQQEIPPKLNCPLLSNILQQDPPPNLTSTIPMKSQQQEIPPKLNCPLLSNTLQQDPPPNLTSTIPVKTQQQEIPPKLNCPLLSNILQQDPPPNLTSTIPMKTQQQEIPLKKMPSPVLVSILEQKINFFPCQYCDQTFKYHSALVCHELSHKCNISHKCNRCSDDMQFSNDSLPVHSSSNVTTEKRCTFCGVTFINESYLLNHMKKKHLNTDSSDSVSQSDPIPMLTCVNSQPPPPDFTMQGWQKSSLQNLATMYSTWNYPGSQVAGAQRASHLAGTSNTLATAAPYFKGTPPPYHASPRGHPYNPRYAPAVPSSQPPWMSHHGHGSSGASSPESTFTGGSLTFSDLCTSRQATPDSDGLPIVTVSASLSTHKKSSVTPQAEKKGSDDNMWRPW